MKTSAQSVFNIMHVLVWIVFIGLLIKTGALVFSVVISLFINAKAAYDLYEGLNLAELLRYSQWQYAITVLNLISMGVLKAYIAYLAIRIFAKIDLASPFSETVAQLIGQIASVSLATGLFAIMANAHGEWLMKRGVDAPGYNGGEFLFLAGIIFLIAQIFKRGVDLQSENDLTI